MTDAASPVAPPYQSLYRRFRPQRFDEVLGQDHVSLALRNAVRQGIVGHAYLFSGPRGTGKTSTARILAKALNCTAPDDGEPCGVCASCVEIAAGTSLDVHELDAASNNGVDAMRDLVARAALGTPGRWKVYIVDEVHMLTAAASNALLKTLEEPPGHVVFVLATTDAQKVLPTIRSRTQHFEFRLLGPGTLAELVRSVRDAAGLGLGDDAVAAAVRRGRGSARDALSVLDQLSAAGVVDDELLTVAELGEALADHDAARALVAVAQAVAAGRDIHHLTGSLVEHLRQGFLATVAPDLVTLAGDERSQIEDMARRLGLPGVVRAMESLGRAQVDMRDALDPRVDLETALIRLAHPAADDSPAAVLERLDRLERAIAGGGLPPQAPDPVRRADPDTATVRSPAEVPSTGTPDPPVEGSPPATGGPALARQSLGALRRQAGGARAAVGPEASAGPPAPQRGRAPTAAAETTAGAAAAPARPGHSTLPSRDDLVQAWGDLLLAKLPSRARARFRVGRFVDVDESAAVFALPNDTHRSYCEDVRRDVEEALSAHFGTSVPLRLVVDDDADPATPAPGRARAAAPEPLAEEDAALLDPEILEAETEPAGAGLSPEQRLKQMFPGAEEL